MQFVFTTSSSKYLRSIQDKRGLSYSTFYKFARGVSSQVAVPSIPLSHLTVLTPVLRSMILQHKASLIRVFLSVCCICVYLLHTFLRSLHIRINKLFKTRRELKGKNVAVLRRRPSSSKLVSRMRNKTAQQRNTAQYGLY